MVDTVSYDPVLNEISLIDQTKKNWAFDITPISLITGFITPHGITKKI